MTVVSARTAPAPWMAPAVSWTAGGVGVAALTVSAVELYLLATALHFHPLVAVALFIGVDLGAAAGAIMRVGSPRGTSMARYGQITTWCLVLASSALNGTSVLTRPGSDTPGKVGLLPSDAAVSVAFLIAVVFPIVAALMVELVLLAHAVPAATPTRTRAGVSRQEPARAPVAPQAPAPAREESAGSSVPVPPAGSPTPGPVAPTLHAVPAPARPAPTKQERAEHEWKRRYRETGEEASPADMNRFVDGKQLVKGRHVQQWREEVDAEPAAQAARQ